MNAQKRGKQYELDLCNAVYDACDGELIPEPIGYSGNHKIPAPDIRINDGKKVHAFELKRSTDDRLSVFHEPDNPQKDDLHQLFEYCRRYPRTVCPYIGIRFTNRQLVLLKLWLEAPNDTAVLRSATNLAPVDVRLTRAGNLSVHKPENGEWPSATAGDDAQHVLETIGYW